MVKRKSIDSTWQSVLDITFASAGARLPAAVLTERRDTVARYALLSRIHREFEEMPGLSLTRGQAAKLFGLPPDIASRILERLTDALVLCQNSDGQFALRVDGS